MQKPQVSKGSYYQRMKQAHKELVKQMADDALAISSTYAGALDALQQADKEAEQERKQPSEGATFIGLATKAERIVKNKALNQNPNLIEVLLKEFDLLLESDDLTSKGYQALLKTLNLKPNKVIKDGGKERNKAGK